MLWKRADFDYPKNHILAVSSFILTFRPDFTTLETGQGVNKDHTSYIMTVDNIELIIRLVNGSKLWNESGAKNKDFDFLLICRTISKDGYVNHYLIVLEPKGGILYEKGGVMMLSVRCGTLQVLDALRLRRSSVFLV